MEIIGIVPFRGGSKGLENKNFRILNGLPLWRKAVNQAVKVCDRVIVSTDRLDKCDFDGFDTLIQDRRPDHLASDNASMADVLMHLISRFKLDNKILVLLQPTSPLRKICDIESAVRLFNSSDFDMVFSVVEKDNACLKYGLVKNHKFDAINKSEHLFQNRQELPKVFGPNGAIYVFNSSIFMQQKSFPASNIGYIEMNVDDSLDIDNYEDFLLAEKYFEERQEPY